MRISARPFINIACLLVVSAAILSGCSGAEARIDRHVERGNAYLSRGRYPEARIEFRSALQIDRRNAPAQYGLGRAALAMGYLQEAAEAFYQTMRLDPSNLQARLEVGNLLAGYPDDESLKEAQRLAGEVLAKDPASVEAQMLTATIAITRRNWDEAQAILERTIAAAPQRIEPRLHLARYFSLRATVEQEKRWQSAAESGYRQLVESNPRNPEARLALGEFLFSTGRADEAEKELLSAVEADPVNKVALLALVRFYEDRRRYDQAERYLTRLVELDEDKVEGRSQIIELRARAGRTSDAVGEYRRLLRDNPDYLRGYSRLAELLIESGDVRGATIEVERALRLSPQDTDALLIRGRLHTLAGRHAEALRDLDQVLRLEPSMPSALYFAAEAGLRNNDPARARMLVNRLLSFSPRNPMGLLMSAKILLAENRRLEAETVATQALESIRTLKRNPSDARLIPSDSLAGWESKALVTRAIARMMNGPSPDARADLIAASGIDPRNAEPLVNLATLALAEKRYDDAMKFAARAIEIDPAGPAALSVLVDARLALRDYDGALRQIDELQAAGPLADEQRARILMARGESAGAEKILRDILESHPDHLNAYFLLSELYQSSSGRTDRAIAELRRLIERRPESGLGQAHLMIGLLEDGRGEHQRAVESYERVLAYDKRSATAAIALNNLAWLFAEKGLGNLDQAVDYARRAIAILPEPAFFDTLGYAYLKKGQHRIAAEQFSRALAGNPSNPVYSRHLREAEKLSGRK
ncbi:MAG: tetratricopeptide repeat protein [Blastocatellales bacterium]